MSEKTFYQSSKAIQDLSIEVSLIGSGPKSPDLIISLTSFDDLKATITLPYSTKEQLQACVELLIEALNNHPGY